MVKSYTGLVVVPVTPPPPDPWCGPGGSGDGRVAVGWGVEEILGGGGGARVGVPESPPLLSCSSSSAVSTQLSPVADRVGSTTTTSRFAFPPTNALPWIYVFGSPLETSIGGGGGVEEERRRDRVLNGWGLMTTAATTTTDSLSFPTMMTMTLTTGRRSNGGNWVSRWRSYPITSFCGSVTSRGTTPA